MTPLLLLVIGGGVFLAWSGLTGSSPLAEITAALTGDTAPRGKTPLVDGAGSSTPAPSTPTPTEAGGSASELIRRPATNGGFPWNPAAELQAGSAPAAVAATSAALARFAGTSYLGIMGDEAHQSRDSDHNRREATDIGVPSVAVGDAVAAFFAAAHTLYKVKYIIWHGRIWRPGSGWAPHSGDPHNHHVHVSVTR